MDLTITEQDFLLACSNYSSLIATAKTHVKKFEDEMRPHAQQMLKNLSEKRYKPFTELDEHIELWLGDLKTHLHQFEYYGRASTLKTFFHLSSYLHTLRPPVVRTNECRHKIPVCDIVFPKKQEIQLPSGILKPEARIRKKCWDKSSKNINVCR